MFNTVKESLLGMSPECFKVLIRIVIKNIDDMIATRYDSGAQEVSDVDIY